jgi:SAM-dependent methyltransferase
MTPLPSEWVRRWSHLVPTVASVLDVACGSGRHVRWFAERGCRVTGVDRDAVAIEPLRDMAELLHADIENAPWPLAGRQFDAVVVTNYLWRPLLPTLVASLAEGGVLIYETFADGNQAFGKPSNPDFLLRPGELLRATEGLDTVAYENGYLDDPSRHVQRIVATKLRANVTPRPRLEPPPRPTTRGRLKSSDSEEPA